MNIFKFTLIDIFRTKLFFGILFLSLSVAFTTVSYLYFYGKRIEKRFDLMPDGMNMIVGAKTSDHKILLGALLDHYDAPRPIPYTLYESFNQSMTIVHGDNVKTSINYIEKVIPILYLGKIKNLTVVATNKKLFDAIKPHEISLGIDSAKNLNLKIGDELQIPGFGYEKKMKIANILPRTNTIWDNQIFLDIDFYYNETKGLKVPHSIWGHRVLHYMYVWVMPASIERFRSLVNQRTVAQVIVKDEALEDINQLLMGEKKIITLVSNIIIFLSLLLIFTIFLILGNYKKSVLKSLKLFGLSETERISYLGLEIGLIVILPFVIGVSSGHYLLQSFFPSALF